MVGFRATDAYEHVVLEYFELSLSGTQGIRVGSARIEYNTDKTKMELNPISGGLSTAVTRASAGLYEIIYPADGVDVLSVFVSTESLQYHAFVREATVSGCKVMIYDITGAALADAPFTIKIVGR